MTIKIIGCVITFIVSALIGYLLSIMPTFQCMDLENLKKSLMIIKTEIVYMNNPLPEVFAALSKKTTKPYSEFYRNLAESCNLRTGISIADIWNASVDKHLKQAYLDDDDLSQIKSLGGVFCSMDKMHWSENIVLMIHIIDTKLEVIREKAKVKSKMYRSLGVLTGLAIIVMLI